MKDKASKCAHPDILPLILQHTSTPALTRCMVVSRDFAAAAGPILYRHLPLDRGPFLHWAFPVKSALSKGCWIKYTESISTSPLLLIAHHTRLQLREAKKLRKVVVSIPNDHLEDFPTREESAILSDMGIRDLHIIPLPRSSTSPQRSNRLPDRSGCDGSTPPLRLDKVSIDLDVTLGLDYTPFGWISRVKPRRVETSQLEIRFTKGLPVPQVFTVLAETMARTVVALPTKTEIVLIGTGLGGRGDLFEWERLEGFVEKAVRALRPNRAQSHHSDCKVSEERDDGRGDQELDQRMRFLLQSTIPE